MTATFLSWLDYPLFKNKHLIAKKYAQIGAYKKKDQKARVS